MKKKREHYFNKPAAQSALDVMYEARQKKLEAEREHRQLKILEIITNHEAAEAAILIESLGTFWEDFPK